jgi:hypothetical protein
MILEPPDRQIQWSLHLSSLRPYLGRRQGSMPGIIAWTPEVVARVQGWTQEFQSGVLSLSGAGDYIVVFK